MVATGFRIGVCGICFFTTDTLGRLVWYLLRNEYTSAALLVLWVLASDWNNDNDTQLDLVWSLEYDCLSGNRVFHDAFDVCSRFTFVLVFGSKFTEGVVDGFVRVLFSRLLARLFFSTMRHYCLVSFASAWSVDSAFAAFCFLFVFSFFFSFLLLCMQDATPGISVFFPLTSHVGRGCLLFQYPQDKDEKRKREKLGME